MPAAASPAGIVRLATVVSAVEPDTVTLAVRIPVDRAIPVPPTASLPPTLSMPGTTAFPAVSPTTVVVPGAMLVAVVWVQPAIVALQPASTWKDAVAEAPGLASVQLDESDGTG